MKIFALIIILAIQNGTQVIPVSAIENLPQEAVVETQQEATVETPIVSQPEVIPVVPEPIKPKPVAPKPVDKKTTEFNVDGMVLKQGKLSTEVLRLNKYLKLLGYDVNETYEFNNKTTLAIKKYQKSKGLTVDGSVGKLTLGKLNLDMKQKGINIGAVKISLTDNREMIIINKSSNTLYHMKNNNVIAQYSVATGKSHSPTPEGKFTIVTKAINPSWGGAGKYKPIKGGASNNPLGKRWMGLSIRGGGTYGIHGNSNSNSIGTYASMGCIRMHNNAVEKLYPLISKGTPVWIGFENTLNSYGVKFYIEN